MTFYQWLMKQRHRDDPIGDLARDAKEDDCSFARGPNVGYTKWETHLCVKMACSGAMEALEEAWTRYLRADRASGDWTKKAAIQRMKKDMELQALLYNYPEVQPLINEAIAQENVEGYHRIRTYIRLKREVFSIVGWGDEEREARVATRVIDDLLPPDDVDREGDRYD